MVRFTLPIRLDCYSPFKINMVSLVLGHHVRMFVVDDEHKWRTSRDELSVWYMLRDWPNHAKSALLQQGKAWETELKDASSSLNVSSSKFAYFMCYALPLSCWHFSGFDDSTNSNVGELRLASSSQATSVRVKRDEGFDAKYNLAKLSLCFSIYFLTVESTVVSPSWITSLIGSALKLARLKKK